MNKYAIIDVGSNSVRLLLVDNNSFVSKNVITTRLAEGLCFSSMLSEDAISRTVQAIEFFYMKAMQFNANVIHILATEAVRSAKNSNVFISLLAKKGLPISILSPEEEAFFGFKGVATSLGMEGVLDVGGASTELTVADSGNIIYSKSIPIGIVKLKNQISGSFNEILSFLAPFLSPFKEAPKMDVVYGIGGSATLFAGILQNLAVYQRNKVDNYKIHKSKLFDCLNFISSLPEDQLSSIKGLPKEREDIAIYGGSFLYCVMDMFNLSTLIAKDRDGMEGFIEENYHICIN